MGKGPDVRWVGNEGGVGRTTEWSVVPLPTAPDQCRWPDMMDGDLGSRAKLTPGSHLWWYPAEVNITMLDNSAWFWAPQQTSPELVTQLVDIYYTVHRPQRKSHPESFAGHARADSRQPA